MSANESFIAALVTIAGTMLALNGAVLVSERWVRRRAKRQSKP